MRVYIKLILIIPTICKFTYFICSPYQLLLHFQSRGDMRRTVETPSCSICAHSQLRSNKVILGFLFSAWPENEDRRGQSSIVQAALALGSVGWGLNPQLRHLLMK